jgi:hypothetical protein
MAGRVEDIEVGVEVVVVDLVVVKTEVQLEVLGAVVVVKEIVGGMLSITKIKRKVSTNCGTTALSPGMI